MKSALACLVAIALGMTLMAHDDDPPAKKQKSSPGFESLKKLVGEWSCTGPDGKPATTKFKLSAGGSILHETMFPDTPHEMITIYHMDGNDLILTHYCMMGNQPRLKAADASNAKKLSFKSVGGTNMTLKDAHMGQAVITFVDNDHFEAEWCSCTNGEPDPEHKFHAKFTRKK